MIKTNVFSKATATYNDNGEFQATETLPYGFPMTVELSDSSAGLATLKGLYKAVKEINLGGDGGIQSTLDELIGGQFWAKLYHKKGNDGILREQLDTWRFRSQNFGPPATVAVAQ